MARAADREDEEMRSQVWPILPLSCLGCALACPAGAAKAQPIAPEVAALYDLLENGGFEEGAEVPAWWSRFPAKDTDGNRHLLDTSEAHSGRSSALIWSVTPHETGKAGFQWNKYGLAVEGGSTLVVSYWIRTDGAGPIGTGIHFYDRDGNHVGFERQQAPADAREWVYVRKEVPVPRVASKMGLALYAQDEVKTWYDDVALLGTPTTEAVRGTPKLDGELGDACWGEEGAIGDFVLQTGAGLPGEKIRAWLAYDDANLYVAFRCPHAAGAKLKAEADEHDGDTWLDDSMEVFLDPWHGHSDYYQLCVNCRGVIRDSRGRDTSWDSGARAAVRQQAEAWTIELAIPFENLDLNLDVGTVWGINLVRNDRVRGEVSTWSLGGFHAPGRFGNVSLEPELGGPLRADLARRLDAAERAHGMVLGEMTETGLDAEALAEAWSLMDRAATTAEDLRRVSAGQAAMPDGGWEAVRALLASVTEAHAAARRAAINALFGFQGAEEAGFRVVIGSPLQKMRRSGPVEDGLIAREVRLQAARDEAESFQLIVVPVGGALEGVTVEAGELRGPGGSVPVKWNPVGYVETAEPVYETEYVGWWPDPLLPAGPFDVTADQRQPVWFTVEVPAEAPPGLYEGQVTIRHGDKGVSVPVELRVMNFRLPRPGTLSTAFGMYVPYVARWWFGNESGKMPIEAYARLCEFLGKYRLAPKNAGREYISVWREGEKYVVDMSQLHQTVGKLAPQYYAPYSYAVCRISLPEYWWRSDRSSSYSVEQEAAKVGEGCLRVSLRADDQWAGVSRVVVEDNLWMKECDRTRFWLRAADEQSAQATLDVCLNVQGGRYVARVPVGSMEWHEVVLPIASFRHDKTGEAFTVETFRTLRTLQFVVTAAPQTVSFLVDEIEAEGPQGRVLIDPCEGERDVGAARAARFVRACAEEYERQGLPPEVFVYGFDEPRPEDYPFLRSAYMKIRESGTKYPIMQTIGDPNPRELVGVVDIWCPLTARLDSDFYAERLQAGDTLWTYVCCGPRPPHANFFVDQPATDHRMVFWQARQHGATGVLYWCVTIWDGLPMAHQGGPCFPDVPIRLEEHMTYKSFKVNGDGLIVYPGKDVTLLSSIRLETIRDGIEDYEYLALLERLVRKAEALPEDRRPAAEMLEEARELMRVPEEISRTMTEYTKDPRVILERRREVAEAIERLVEAVGKE